MKNIFRVIGFGLAVVAFSATNSFAQNPCEDTYEVKTAALEKFKTNNTKPITIEKLKVALQAGNDFNTRYKDCPDEKPIVEYITKKLPPIEAYIKETERNIKFDNGVKNKVWADAFSAGKEIIAANSDKPISLNVALALASIGFDRAQAKDDTFNNDTIAMAELAIKKMDSGIISEDYGLSYGTPDTSYVYKTTKYPDGKQNALGWMNYTIGYIKYSRQSKQKDALPYLYTAATKYNSATKNIPDLFVSLGVYYYGELQKIDTKRVELEKANGNKETDDSKALWDLEKGYFERAIDAYARAYKIATANVATAKPDKKPKLTEYKDGLYKDLQGLYKDRFTKLDGLDAYIAAQTSKPLPDPTSEVMPIKEVVPTTTTTTSTTTTKPVTTTTTTTTTKPTTTTTTTNPTTTTKPSSSTTTPKKPTKPKKKSGR